MIALTYWFQGDHVQAAAAIDDVAALGERVGDPFHVGRRWVVVGQIAQSDGRLPHARDAYERARAAVKAGGDPFIEALADAGTAFIDIWDGEPERALMRLEDRLERALKLGVGLAVPVLLLIMAWAELAAGRHRQACDRLEALVPIIEGREMFVTSWALRLLSEAQRLLADGTAEATALRAQASADKLGNRLICAGALQTLGRLAAAGGEWTVARQHALAALDACAEGGHATSVPGCLDALGEVAAGLGSDSDAVRLLAAADRARADIGVVRFPPEEQHWAAIDRRLRDALGDGAYDAARAQGTELSTEDALEWARRARGPRTRPPGGWDSLTPTEARVVELVAEGLTNPQIGERMFISAGTVKTHVAHIFGKLELHSRTVLGAQAVERKKTAR